MRHQYKSSDPSQKKRETSMKRLLMPGSARTFVRKVAFTLLCCTVLMVFGASAQTPQVVKADPGANTGPPAGAILDLNGQPIPTSYQLYTVDFTAALNSTAITFAFRNDPSFTSFANASVVDLTAGNGTNLLLNGNFSGGVFTSGNNTAVPNSWTYSNQYGATYGGVVDPTDPCAAGYPYCWYDGAVQAYDAISQPIATNVGDNYQISFYVTAGGGSTFSDISTNGDTTDTNGNGIDVAVYAQAGLPPPNQTLTLNLLNSGTGTVADSNGGTCSEADGVVTVTGDFTLTATGACSASYGIGMQVTLTATASAPSTFGDPTATPPILGWGGACASVGTTSPPYQCALTMNTSQTASAAFVAPGQTQTGTVTPGQPSPTVYAYSGGCSPNGNGCSKQGYDYTAIETDTSQTVQMTVTAIPTTQTACNALMQANFPGAECFDYVNGGGTQDASVMFEVTCSNGPCGSNTNPFDAIFASDFTFNYCTVGENCPLTATDFAAFSGIPPYPIAGTTLPGVGFLKGEGPNSNHPCTPDPLNPTGLFQSNQIISFTLGDTTSVPTKGGSGGSASCWVVTYNTPNEIPTIPPAQFTQPVNNGIYPQGSTTAAAFTCNAVSTITSGNPNPATGPYLTVNACTATDTYGTPPQTSNVAPGAQFDTNTVGLHTFTAMVTDSASNINTATVIYYVQGNQSPLTLIATPLVYNQSEFLSVRGGSTGGTVTYNLVSGTCTLSGNQLTANSGTGSCVVSATMAGNNSYNPVTSALTTVNLTLASQTITFPTIPTQAYVGTPIIYTLNASSSSGLPVSYTVNSGSATVSGSSLTITGAGSVKVTASQLGNTNYASATPVSQTFSVNSAALLSVTPSSYNYGTVDLYFDLNPGIVTVKNIGTATANISNVSLTRGSGTNQDDFTLINLCPSTLAVGKTCYISVLFFAGNVGTVSATLNIASNSPGSPQQVTFTANVINPLVSFNPTSLNFGTIKHTTTSTLPVKLSNPGTTPLTITSIGITGNFTQTNNCTSPIAANGYCTIQVTFRPGAVGTFSGTLTVKDNAPLGTQIVPLSGKGN